MSYKVIKEFPQSGNEVFNKIFKKDNILEGYTVPTIGQKSDIIKISTEPNSNPTQLPTSIIVDLKDLVEKGYLEEV